MAVAHKSETEPLKNEDSSVAGNKTPVAVTSPPPTPVAVGNLFEVCRVDLEVLAPVAVKRDPQVDTAEPLDTQTKKVPSTEWLEEAIWP